MFKSLKTSHYINTFLLIFFTMSNLVVKVEVLLLQESFDTLCGASVVYLTIEDNILPPYDKVRKIVDRADNSSLAKLTDLG